MCSSDLTGRWQEAIARLSEVAERDPGYEDVEALLESARGAHTGGYEPERVAAAVEAEAPAEARAAAGTAAPPLPPVPTTPPLPPGTQIKSSRGQFSKVCVGTRLRPLSLETGAADFAMMCIADCGNRAKTCCGPVKSSCVSSGKMTKPTLKSDMLGSIRLEA